MKNIKVVKYGSDGMVRKIGLKYDNGLILVCTDDMVFCGAERREEILRQLEEITGRKRASWL